MPTVIISSNTTGLYVGDYASVEDTQLKQNNATTNYNTNVTNEATSWNVGDVVNSIIKWGGITSAPAGTVSNAKIGVYITFSNSTPHDVGVYPMLRNVVFNQANWNVYSTGNNWGTAGALGAGDIGTIVSTYTKPSNATGIWVEFTGAGLDALVQDWLDGTNTLLTVLLKQVIHTLHGADAFAYRSSEGTDGQRPYLQYDYTAGGGTITCTVGNATASGNTASINSVIAANLGQATASGYAASINSTINATQAQAVADGYTASINSTIVCTAGSASASGFDASVNSAIACTAGNATASGFDATLTQGGIIQCTVGNSTADGHDVSINSTLICSRADATADGYTATVLSGGIITCTVAQASANGFDVSINSTTVCTQADGVADGYTANISATNIIACTLGQASASGYDATLATTIVCDNATATADGYTAFINSTLLCGIGQASADGYDFTIFDGSVLNRQYPLAGLDQTYPLTGLKQTYPLE